MFLWLCLYISCINISNNTCIKRIHLIQIEPGIPKKVVKVEDIQGLSKFFGLLLCHLIFVFVFV